MKELYTLLIEYLILGVMLICLFVGFILKNMVKTDKINPYIPLVMAVLGVVLNMWFNGWVFNPEILIAGLASGLAASGAYDGFKAIKTFFGNIAQSLKELKKMLNDTDELNE